MYKVIGGVWSDTTWSEIVPGTEEEYGPFETYEEAVKVWRGRVGWMVDTCSHRLFVVQIGEDHTDAFGDMKAALFKINEIVFGLGVCGNLGIEPYFEIRGLCCETLKKHGLYPPIVAPLPPEVVVG